MLLFTGYRSPDCDLFVEEKSTMVASGILDYAFLALSRHPPVRKVYCLHNSNFVNICFPDWNHFSNVDLCPRQVAGSRSASLSNVDSANGSFLCVWRLRDGRRRGQHFANGVSESRQFECRRIGWLSHATASMDPLFCQLEEGKHKRDNDDFLFF